MASGRAHVIFSGRVQGVFFRAFTEEHARAQGLRGWVRNLPDGRVEAVFEGPRDDIEKVIRICEQGPAGASVTDVDISWESPQSEGAFRVRYH